MKTKTQKKVKIVGTEQYINQRTGEIQEMQVINIQERDFNFHKIWLEHILTSIDLIGNQKTKLAFWIMNNLDKENRLIMTQREIAAKTKMSTKTVTDTLKALMNSNFLQKIHSGAYRINPDVLFKGGKTDRINVLLQYRESEAVSSSKTNTQEDGQGTSKISFERAYKAHTDDLNKQDIQTMPQNKKHAQNDRENDLNLDEAKCEAS